MTVLARLAGWAKDRVLERRALTEALQTARYRLRYASDRPVVVVHQMGRVGSVTVTRALRRALPDRHVFHTHYLNPATMERHYAHFQHIHHVTGRAGLHRHFLSARVLQARLRQGVRGRWKIVSLVRDPVARTVSLFFHSFPFSFVGLGPPVCETPDDASRLLSLYLGDWALGHRFALDWFDAEVRDVFGIDVYATPFPRAEGHALYRGATCDLLVIRLEDLDRCGRRVLQEFLGIESLELVTANRGDDHAYAEAFRRFKTTATLPASYLDLMYDSRLARHFYSDAERAAFRARWAQD
jgi:hypothetical protein